VGVALSFAMLQDSGEQMPKVAKSSWSIGRAVIGQLQLAYGE
jgi:hypothetical protein